MKHPRIIKIPVFLLALLLASLSLASAFAISFSTSQEYLLSLQIHLEKNKLFSKYNVQILLDNQSVGVVAQGEDFQYATQAKAGLHTVSFIREDSPDIRNVTQFITASDVGYQCVIKAKAGTVEISNEQINGLDYSMDSLPMEQFEALCSRMSYDDVSRYPDLYKEMAIKVSGKATQVMSNNILKDMFLLTVTDSYGNPWLVKYNLPSGSARILSGDPVTIWGRYKGLDHTHTTSGILSYQELLPTVEAHFLNLGSQGILPFINP